MPRKTLFITHERPYHIVARSNNREWFYIPIDECWKIFTSLLGQASFRFRFQIHAFVLMNNHYHLIATASEMAPLPEVMHWFQRSANRTINQRAGRINHLFGGPYRATLLSSELSYFHALKYVYRNPVAAKMTKRVEDYSYSSLANPWVPLVSPVTGIEVLLPKSRKDLLGMLNEDYSEPMTGLIRKALNQREFKIPKRIPRELRAQVELRG